MGATILNESSVTLRPLIWKYYPMTSKYDVWYVVPSANPVMAEKTIPAWREAGCKVAVFLDTYDPDYKAWADKIVRGVYQGYAKAVNALLRQTFCTESLVVVTGGDDMYPDPRFKAQELAYEFCHHFPDTFGVMQPSGDQFGAVGHICGSPWLGRAFIDRINQGRGPFWEGYHTEYSDREMYDVTNQLGIFLDRPDVSQFHAHWRRGNPKAQRFGLNRKKGRGDRALYFKRKKAGFPGHEPLDEGNTHEAN